MMFAFPPTHGPLALVIFFIVLLLAQSDRIVRPRNGLALVLLVSILVSPIIYINQVEQAALDPGQYMGDHEWELRPHETRYIQQLTNFLYYTPVDMIFECNGTFNIHIVDENNPNNTVTEVDSGGAQVRIQVSYVLTESLLAANWSLYLQNPSDTQGVYIRYYMPWLEDWPVVGIWDVEHRLSQPSYFLGFFILFMAIAVIRKRTRFGFSDFIPNQEQKICYGILAFAVVIAMPWMILRFTPFTVLLGSTTLFVLLSPKQESIQKKENMREDEPPSPEN